jgi:hypothetical protein
MATKTFYFKDAVPSGATNHRSLQDGGGVIAAATTGTGWELDQKASGQSCLMNGGAEVARTDGQWSASLQPDTAGAVSQTLGDCWRSEDAISGHFVNATWSGTYGFRSVSAAYTGRFRLRYRFWKGKNANGSDAVALSAVLVSSATSANTSTTSDTTIALSWTSPGQQNFDGEYLFLQIGVEVTSVGSGNTQDVLFRVTSGTYQFTSPDFVERYRTTIRRPQPRFMIGINPKWRMRGLQFAWVASMPLIEHARRYGVTAYQTGAAPYSHTKFGSGWNPNATTNDGVTFGNARPISDGANFSIAVLAAPSRSGSGRTLWFNQRNGSGNAEQIGLSRGSNGLYSSDTRSFQLYWRNTSGSPFYADNGTANDTAPDDLLHLWGGSNKAGTLDIFRDGKNVTVNRTTPSGTATSSSQTTRLGNLAQFSSDGSFATANAHMHACYVFQPALTEAMWAELADDPYGVFEDEMAIFVLAAAGAFVKIAGHGQALAGPGGLAA